MVTSVFPFLNLVEKINIGGFIEGLQGVEMIILIIGDFFKVSVFAYAAVISSTDLFKAKNHHKFVVPIGAMILFTSMTTTGNFVEHLTQGKIVLNSIFPLFEFFVPLLLVIVVFTRHRILRK